MHHKNERMDLGELKISVEDKFIILHLNVKHNLLPTGDTLNKLAYILSSFTPDYQIVCDFREVDIITSDVLNFVSEFEFYDSHVLVNKDFQEFFSSYINKRTKLLPVNNSLTKFKPHDLNLTLFAEGSNLELGHKEYNETLNFQTLINSGVPSEDEYNLFLNYDGLDFGKPFFNNYEDFVKHCKMSKDGLSIGSRTIIPRRFLNQEFIRVGKTSLLNSFCFSIDGSGQFDVLPYQSNSYNNLESKSKLIQGLPYVYSRQTHKIYSEVLNKFKSLLNKSKVKEEEIQKFLETNTFLFENLGYKSVKAQVVLERDDGSFLKPDFMLQPIGEEWWDILDIKTPIEKIITESHKNRFKFLESVHLLQAQLREYGAYFENEKYSKRIEDKYGIKCYKPKLIGVIGNEQYNSEDERQLRRVFSAYSDTQIIPFSKIYEVSKNRLLI